MKKAANNVYNEGSSYHNNNFNRGRGGHGRGRHFGGRRGGKNLTWYNPNYNNNKRPFDAFTQAPTDHQQQAKS